MRPSLFGSGCVCLPAPSCSEPAAHTDVRLRQSGIPAEVRSQRPAIQRYLQLALSVVRFSTLGAAAWSPRPQTCTHAVDRRSNKDAYKPALGSRVDDTLSTIPQKGPSLDMGSAKMVGFYGVLAAAVAAALAYQG